MVLFTDVTGLTEVPPAKTPRVDDAQALPLFLIIVVSPKSFASPVDAIVM